MQTEWIKKLSTLKSKYDGRGLAIRTKIITGSHSSRFVAYTIVKFAEDEGIDLIVVGSVGTGGIPKKKSRKCNKKRSRNINLSYIIVP